MGARDLTRNDPDWAGPVLWAHDRGADNARLLRRYPDRAAWRYVFDPARADGQDRSRRSTMTGRVATA